MPGEEVEDVVSINGQSPICISFSSHIDPNTSQVLLSNITHAANEVHDEIHLFMSTPGGTVNEGICLYNIIRSLPIPVITYNMGSVNSIGNCCTKQAQKESVPKHPALCFME